MQSNNDEKKIDFLTHFWPWGSIKYYRTGLRFNETYFYEMKNKKLYEQPNPWTRKQSILAI